MSLPDEYRCTDAEAEEYIAARAKDRRRARRVIDRIVGDRIARDRAARAVPSLAHLRGNWQRIDNETGTSRERHPSAQRPEDGDS
ncbi:hypothetical protein [Leucobacter musarum]|uniref:hypothetical protein n=1 Tax=Leucobacter musarum TaxID=1930747 RepID=UPI0006A7A3C7|nr:hypothetical protein [Leucobacter musarum]